VGPKGAQQVLLWSYCSATALLSSGRNRRNAPRAASRRRFADALQAAQAGTSSGRAPAPPACAPRAAAARSSRRKPRWRCRHPHRGVAARVRLGCWRQPAAARWHDVDVVAAASGAAAVGPVRHVHVGLRAAAAISAAPRAHALDVSAMRPLQTQSSALAHSDATAGLTHAQTKALNTLCPGTHSN
jgi:hypothetical protein